MKGEDPRSIVEGPILMHSHHDNKGGKEVAHYVSGSNPRLLMHQGQIAYVSVSRSRKVVGSNPSHLPSV